MGTVGADVNIITNPAGKQDFTKPISIRWTPSGAEVANWWLCVGTADGDWNVMSADMGPNLRAAIDASGLSGTLNKLFVRLVYSQLNEDGTGHDNFMTDPAFVIERS